MTFEREMARRPLSLLPVPETQNNLINEPHSPTYARVIMALKWVNWSYFNSWLLSDSSDEGST